MERPPGYPIRCSTDAGWQIGEDIHQPRGDHESGKRWPPLDLYISSGPRTWDGQSDGGDLPHYGIKHKDPALDWVLVLTGGG